MTESFADKRRRELGLTPSTTSSTTKTIEKPKDSDFVAKRKIALGLAEDPVKVEGKKQAESYKQAQKKFNPVLQDTSQPFLAPKKYMDVSVDPSKSPVMQDAKKYNKDHKAWKGPLNNPITRTAAKGLGVVADVYDKVSHLPVVNQVTGAMQGGAAPIVQNNKPIKDKPLWRDIAENVMDVKHLTDIVSNPSLLATDLFKNKSLKEAATSLMHVPIDAVKGAIHPDEARQNLNKALENKSIVNKLAIGSAADPLSYVPFPSIKGIKTASSTVNEAFQKFAARNAEKPIEFEQFQQAAKNRNELNLGEIDRGEEGIVNRFNYMEKQMNKDQPLQLNPSRGEIRQNAARDRSNLEPNTTPVQGRGNVETMALPESNTPRIITDIKNQASALIKPPTSRRGLILYAEQHLEVPRTELIKMNDKDLYELGQMIRNNTNMDMLHSKIATEQGLNWNELISGKSVTGNVEAPVNRLQFKPATERPKPLVGSGGPLEAAPRVIKPKVAPVNATVTPKATVRPQMNEVAAASEVVERPRVIGKPAEVKPTEYVDPTPQKPSEKVIAERGHAQTLKESEKTPQQFKDNLNPEYTKLRNVDAVTQANKRISKSIDDAEAYVMGNSKHSPEKVATAGRLIDEFNKKGDYKKAVTIAEKVSKELTEAGQTVQAASIFNRLTPEGALIRAQAKVTKINEDMTKLGKPVEITARNAQDIKEAAEAIQVANVSKDRAADVIDIMDKLKARQAITEAERTAVQDFLKDANQYVKTKEKPIRERPAAPEMGERRVKDKVISYLDAQEAAAKARMAARRGRANSLPLDEYADMAIIVAAKLAKGTIKTVDISAELIKDFGDAVKPHLAGIFEKAHSLVSQNAKRISKEVVSQAEKIAENYIIKNEAHIKPEDVDFVRSLAKKVSDLSGTARSAASQDLQAVLSSFERAWLGKKVAAVQYISMLLNPLTQVKNIVGNELLFRLNRLSRTLQTPADMIYSGITGKSRTITIKSGPATWDNFFAPSRDYLDGLFQGAKAGWRGVNIEGLTTAYDISGQAFKSKLNPVTYLEKTLGAIMKGFDYAAFNRAVQQRLRETAYLDAINSGIKGKANQIAHIEKYMVNLDDNIAEIAHEFGKKITLQDSSMLANKLQGLRGGLNQLTTGSKDFGVGSLVLPFAKTPANLLMRAIDYSPAGFGKAIMQAGKIMLKKDVDLTRADVIQSISDALLGTGIGAAGLWLASKGVLKGESNSDRDVRELEKLSGITQYQLNASAFQRMVKAMVTGNMKDIDAAAKIQEGDSLYQYEWAQPSSIPLALGANVFKERKDAKQDALRGQKPDSTIKQTIDVSTGALNTLFNTSVLQGIQQAFDFAPGENNKIKAFLTNIVKSAPSMFVPTIVGKVNQFQDSAVRETYSPDFMESVFNPSKAKIPGQAQKLPQKVNTLGQPQTKENSIFDLFLNPATKTKYKPSPEAKEVMDLLGETGDERVAPRAVPRYITGKDPVTKLDKKIMLTGEQLTEYQSIVGKETLRLLGNLPPNLSTERKVKKVIDILSAAGDKGRKEMRKSLNLR